MTSRRQRGSDSAAGTAQPASCARYEPYRRYVVPAAAIDLDEYHLEWVHTYFPDAAAEPKEGYQGMTYPVVERSDRLVLVSGFSTFAALREAGAEWVTVFVFEAANDLNLLELIGAFALGGSPAPTESTEIDANRRGRRP